MTDRAPLLSVRDLTVSFPVRSGPLRRARLQAVRNVSFEIRRGQTLGLVGESGSGKSTAARALVRLVEARGSIRLDGHELTRIGRRALRTLRPRIQMVFQNPYASLDPALTVGTAIAEPIVTHLAMGRDERRDVVARLLERVHLDPSFARRYPSELSGGQRQRVAIARALALQPDLLILDEAVSALDVRTQHQIAELLQELQSSSGMAYLLISHDLPMVRSMADTAAVMYLGEIVEQGPAAQVLAEPAHPYTRALVAAAPSPHPPGDRRDRPPLVLRGEIPSPLTPPPGCSFHTRCPVAVDRCRAEPPAAREHDGSAVRCHLVESPQDTDQEDTAWTR